MRPELLSRLHHNYDTGKAQFEFFSAQTLASHSGINNYNMVCRPAFNDHEMVKFPVHYSGKADEVKFIYLASHRYRSNTHAIAACRFDNIQGRESITTNTIAITNLPNPGLATVIAKDHGQAGSSTFHGR